VTAVTAPQPEKLPLSPMLFQYLVGLFTLKHGLGVNYHVTLGDEVPDEASGMRRDVDITVATPDGEVYEFAGYEVKHWKKKLDVSHVEALAMKLNDMPTVTQRAIVCSSGYTEGAIKKAAHHGVDLYVIKEWTTPIEEQFPDLAPMKGPPSEVFRGSQFYLTWPEWHIEAHMDNAPQMDLIPWDTPLFDADGQPHPAYVDFRSFTEAMLVLSTDILFGTQPMKERIGPMWEALLSHGAIPMPDNPRWPFGHTFGIDKQEVYIRATDDALYRIEAVTVQGQLSWEYSPMLYLAMEKVPTGEMFATALVGVSPVPGRMIATIIPTQGRNLTLAKVALNPGQLNILKQLELHLGGEAPVTSPT
jgi:hypothetical protein